MELLLVYLFIINAIGLLLMHADKQKARKNLWRIPESILISVSLLGGSLGCLIGMRIFRHKTKHPKFYIGLPLILSLQIILLFMIIL